MPLIQRSGRRQLIHVFGDEAGEHVSPEHVPARKQRVLARKHIFAPPNTQLMQAAEHILPNEDVRGADNVGIALHVDDLIHGRPSAGRYRPNGVLRPDLSRDQGFQLIALVVRVASHHDAVANHHDVGTQVRCPFEFGWHAFLVEEPSILIQESTGLTGLRYIPDPRIDIIYWQVAETADSRRNLRGPDEYDRGSGSFQEYRLCVDYRLYPRSRNTQIKKYSLDQAL